MTISDKELGMSRSITRRDLLHGIGALAAGSFLPSCTNLGQLGKTTGAPGMSTNYPPALRGMRGNHSGSFEVAHQLAWDARNSWGQSRQVDDEYDLVIVGGGISGLASAYFYQTHKPDARILILDNHDDFGGHAKRNEFQVGDHRLIGYGGSQSLEEPSGYSKIVMDLLRELSVDMDKFDSAYDDGFYKRHGLAEGIYFDRETWGIDKTISYDLGMLGSYLPLASAQCSTESAVAQMPISDGAKQELLYLLTVNENKLSDIPEAGREKYLESISYRDFLARHLNITEKDVFRFLQDLATDTGLGIESATALGALDYLSMPGWKAAGFPEEEFDPYIYHFPDGNASIARLLVRRLIPQVASGHTMEDIVGASFNYSRLDDTDAPVRLRLNSTVVRVEHESSTGAASRVQLNYVRNGQSYGVRARRCVLACNNEIIPHLCPELPQSQAEALAQQVKAPMLYTNVALTNWRAWKELGLGGALCPGSYHTIAMLDFPVSFAGYQFSDDPGAPIIVHMERNLHRSNEGLSKKEQHRLARRDLLATSFETMERSIRGQLSGMLSGGDFDPARDIAAITVNRWAHGYSYSYSPLFDEVYEDENDERYPHIQGRATFGRIAIANADAGARALLPVAIEQAHRAVGDLL